MVIFHRYLTIVIIFGITTTAVVRGHEFQQDPSHSDPNSKRDSSLLFIDADAPDYPTRDAPPPRKIQSVSKRKPEKISPQYLDTAVIPWTRKQARPGRVSKGTTTKRSRSTTNSHPTTASSSTSATPSPVSTSKPKATNESSLPLTLNTTATSTEASNYDNPLSGLVEEFVNEEGDGGNPRLRRGHAIFDRHGFMFSDSWYFRTSVTPPKMIYGECVTGYGFEDNKYCFPGEICVDKDTLQQVGCPAPCAACAAGGSGTPPDPCAPGCKPGAGCEEPSPDGICMDSTFGTDEYFDLSSTEREPTPMVYFGGLLFKNESCTAYGDAIDTYNRGFDEFNDKTRRLRLESEAAGVFGTGICNWVVARLQCIANSPRLPPTTTPSPPPSPGGSPTDEENVILDRPQGSCQCMVALGEKAVAVKNDNDTEICYIPANRGYHSTCSHEIFLPYGGIDGVKQNGEPYVKMEMQPASKFCVPNAECKPGYKYTGLRCMCKKKYVWEPLTSTCARALRLKPMLCSNSIIIFFAIFIVFKNVSL